MPEPRDPQEYLKLIDDAIFELEEIVRCAEDEEGVLEFTPLVPMYRKIVGDLRTLRAEVAAGRHEFGSRTDLSFMAVVRDKRPLVPIAPMLDMLNRLHKSGFEPAP